MRQQNEADGPMGGVGGEQGAAVSHEAALRAAPGRGPRLGRVLVMDENPMVRETMRRQLIVLGYEVALAADSRDAVAACERACQEGRPFAVVILGVLVDGGWGGAQTLDELKKFAPGSKALVWGDWLNPRLAA